MSDGKAKILIVDDELSIRTSLSLLLGETGYAVSTAEDGFAALATLRNEIPDILLSDLYMPGMTGFELTSVVRRRFPQVRAIAMSGAYRDDQVPSGVAVDAFFQKGNNVGPLLRILQSFAFDDGEIRRRASSADTIWIQPSGYDQNGAAHITICCPECLRAFSQVVGDFRNGVHETACSHCRIRVAYAVVPSLNESTPPAPRQARSTGVRVPAARR